MDKETIKINWFPGANTAAANLINEKYGPQIHVTKWAVRAWLKSKTNSSPLSNVYLWAFKTVIEQRKSASNEQPN